MSAAQQGRRAQGRALARAQRVAALGRARAGGARAARPRGDRDRRRTRARRRSCSRRAPDAAFIALHGRDGEDGTVQALLEAIGIPYTGSGPAACMRCTDKVLAKHLMREAGIPTPDFHSLRRGVDQGARRRPTRCRTSSARSASRWSSSPPARARRWASSSRATSEELPGRAGRRLLLRPHGPDRALRQGPRPGRLGARRARAGRCRCRSSRRSRARRTSTTTSRATRSA